MISFDDFFIINTTTEFHILRHFDKVTDEYVSSLIGQDYFYYDYLKDEMIEKKLTNQEIGFALDTKGSKFDSELTILENPQNVLKFIQNEIKNYNIKWTKSGENQTTEFQIKFPGNIGYCNLLSISDLTSDELLKVKKINRSNLVGEDSVMVNYLEHKKNKQPTNILNIELVKTPKLPFLWITAYPIDQKFIDSESTRFWDDIVILK